ncbi:IMPACT family protein [Chryseolinea lacunae]|uniref:YigZ family protein n=1 Tax=Chryseolinea lacunae TaxID=2801331 RepID=A0ABS1L032_9BACT|nr:YigZ family protein [Chryseolinea lacunae]MBL0745066.1 YigZ family protein [Chryseolinea lacunae]
MPVFDFKTLQAPASGTYKEKGSKFLAFAYPVSSSADIKEKLDALRKEYYDARHHCYAWMLGPDQKNFRAADDGEPNHSAGDPILGQIRAKGLTDVLIVVVRYFGGIKLGVGGLITAYKAAADDALQNAVVIQKEVMATVTLTYDYDATPEAMRLLKDFNATIVRQDFTERCRMEITFSLRVQEKFQEALLLLQALGTAIAGE